MWSGWFRNESWNTCEKSLRERYIYMLDLLLDKSWQLGSIGVPTFCPHWFYTCFYHLADNPPPDPWVTEERTLWRWFHNSRAGAGFAWGPWNKGGNGGKWGWIRWGKHPFFPIKLAPPRMEIQKFKSEAASAALGSEKVGQARTWFLLSCHCWIYHIKAYQSHFCVFCLKFLCPKNCSS